MCRDQIGGGVCRSPALRGSGQDPKRWPGQRGFLAEKGDDSPGRGGDDGGGGRENRKEIRGPSRLQVPGPGWLVVLLTEPGKFRGGGGLGGKRRSPVGGRRCPWGSMCQSFGCESLSISLLGPDLPGPTAGWRSGGREGDIPERAVESSVWCLWPMGARLGRKGGALVVGASRGKVPGL